MHPLQEELLELSKIYNLKDYSFRRIGRELLKREEHPQKIKHHLEQLKMKGLLKEEDKGFKHGKAGKNEELNLIFIPVYGAVSCGSATALAEDAVESYLRVSPNTIKKSRDIFALRASGSSLNRAKVNGLSVDEGDYVIVDSANKDPDTGDYVVSIIDGCANLKKFARDEETGRVFLLSESDAELPPIVIDAKDEFDYLVAGTAIEVIKQPKLQPA